MLSSARRFLLTREPKVELVGFVLAALICLLNMALLWVLLQRHWGNLSSHQQAEGLFVMVMHPIPCLHFFKRFQDANSRMILGIATFILMSLMMDLILH